MLGSRLRNYLPPPYFMFLIANLQPKLNLKKSSQFFFFKSKMQIADAQKGAPSNINVYRLDIVLEVEHQ